VSAMLVSEVIVGASLRYMSVHPRGLTEVYRVVIYNEAESTSMLLVKANSTGAFIRVRGSFYFSNQEYSSKYKSD